MNKKASLQRRINRTRARIKTQGRKRKLSVFRSNKYISAQIVDLTTGKTLLGLTESQLPKKELVGKTKTEKARILGGEIAKKALKKGIKKAAFDRGGYKYHGRVKAVAEGAREGGLKL